MRNEVYSPITRPQSGVLPRREWLQSHFDTEMSGSASQAEFNDDAAVRISGNANRAMLAHQVGQDAVNDWLSAKLTPEFGVRWG
jgi:hypothetical protein